MASVRLPHGYYSLIIAMIATVAWILSLLQDGCDFAKVEGPIVQRLAVPKASGSSNAAPPWLEFGFAAYREPVPEDDLDDDYWPTLVGTGATDDFVSVHTEQCIRYPDEYIDASWMTAKAFAFLALVMGGGGTLFIFCSTCFVFSKVTWRWAGYELLAAAFFQCIALMVWFTTEICSWNICVMFWGSKLDLIAACAWLLGGIMIIAYYPPPKSVNNSINSINSSIDDGNIDTNDVTTNSSNNNNMTNGIRSGLNNTHSIDDSNGRFTDGGGGIVEGPRGIVGHNNNNSIYDDDDHHHHDDDNELHDGQILIKGTNTDDDDDYNTRSTVSSEYASMTPPFRRSGSQGLQQQQPSNHRRIISDRSNDDDDDDDEPTTTFLRGAELT